MRISRIVLVVLFVTTVASNAWATRLLFESATGSFGDFATLPNGYGNRVTSAVQDGFKYDLAGGPTPNITTKFGSAQGLVEIYTWSSDYGDLANVVFAQEPKPFEFRLIADPGSLVRLDSLDMAGWPHLNFASIASVSVEDALGSQLFRQNAVAIFGVATGPQHTHFSFPGIVGQELRIKFDSTTDGFGNVLDSDDVGIDNISFGQVSTTGVTPESVGHAARLALSVSPNPFEGCAQFSVEVPADADVAVDVYDVRGARMTHLSDRSLASGTHQFSWDGRDAAGVRRAGLYWVRASSAGAVAVKSVLLIR